MCSPWEKNDNWLTCYLYQVWLASRWEGKHDEQAHFPSHLMASCTRSFGDSCGGKIFLHCDWLRVFYWKMLLVGSQCRCAWAIVSAMIKVTCSIQFVPSAISTNPPPPPRPNWYPHGTPEVLGWQSGTLLCPQGHLPYLWVTHWLTPPDLAKGLVHARPSSVLPVERLLWSIRQREGWRRTVKKKGEALMDHWVHGCGRR